MDHITHMSEREENSWHQQKALDQPEEYSSDYDQNRAFNGRCSCILPVVCVKLDLFKYFVGKCLIISNRQPHAEHILVCTTG